MRAPLFLGLLASSLHKLQKFAWRALLLWLVVIGLAQAGAPTVTLRTPVSGSEIAAETTTALVALEGVVQTFDSQGHQSVELWEGTRLLASATPSSASLASYRFSVPFELGAHRVEMRATDGLNRSSSSFGVFTVVVGKPPIVVMSSPKDGDSLVMKSDLQAIFVTGTATPVSPYTLAKFEVLSDGKVIGSSTTGSYNGNTNGVSKGVHSLQIRATDNIGAIGYSAPINVTLIATPPTATITSPEQGGTYGTLTASATMAVRGTALGNGATIKKIELWEGATLLGNPAVASSTYINKTFALGPHSIEWRVTDSHDEVTSHYVDFTVVQAVPPTVTITAPAQGAVLPMAGDLLSIRVSGGTTVYHHVDIAKVEVMDGGTPIASGGATLNNVATLGLKMGPHAIRLKATDVLGQVSYSDTMNITLTGTPPTATLTLPENNGTYFALAGSRTLGVTGAFAGTTGATVTKVELWEGNTLLASASNPAAAVVFNKPFGLGKHTVEWRVTDSRGTASSAFATFTIVPAVPPSVELTSPSAGSVIPMSGNFMLPVSGVATADGSTSDRAKIVKLEVLDGTRVAYTTTTASTLTAVPVPGLLVGEHVLTLRATDSVGSVTVSDPVPITTTATGPTVTVTSPLPGDRFAAAANATVVVTGTASGTNGATIAKIELLEKGVLLGTATSLSAPTISASLTQGAHTIEWRATDNRGVATSLFVDFVVVRGTQPKVTMSQPVDGQVLPMTGNLQGIYVTGAAVPFDHATITRLDVLDGETSLYTSTVRSEIVDTPGVGMPAGPHVIRLRAIDSAGNIGYSDPVNIVLTAAPPTGVITAPSEGLVVRTSTSSATVAVSGTATMANAASLAKIELWEGSTLLGTATASPATFNKSFTLGAHTLEWRVTDGRGTVASQFVSFSVAPGDVLTVTASAPLNGSTFGLVTGTTYAVPVIAQASPVAPLTTTKMEVLEGTTVKATVSNSSILNTTVPLAVGSHALQIRATDSSGKTALTPISTITVAVSPPTPKLTAPVDGSSYAATASGTASVTVAGSATAVNGATVTKLELMEEGAVLQTFTAASFSVARPFAVGQHAIQVRATDSTGRTGLSPITTLTVYALAQGNSAEFISQTVPLKMRAGQPYSVTVKMLNTGTVAWSEANAYRLGSSNPTNTRTWSSTGRAYLSSAVAVGAIGTFTIPVTAPSKAGSYNFQWQMVQDIDQWFGEPTENLVIEVEEGSGPSATLAISPTNVRMVGTTPATLAFAASAKEYGHKITKLDVLVDAGAGYSATPVKSATGNISTLALNFTATATAGIYRYKVRATDEAGVQTDSDPVIISVTDSTLLGSVGGVRIDSNNKPILFGWLCKPGDATPLPYRIMLDAPTPATGGTILKQGTANVSTEPDDAAVQAACGTPGVSHSFTVDLSGDAPVARTMLRAAAAPMTNAYAGRALYVQPLVVVPKELVLPCADNNCTMPGSMRIGLSAPEDGATMEGPDPLFVRAVTSGVTGVVDDVSIAVDGVWSSAQADTTAGTYYLKIPDMQPRAAPYAVMARIRQGSTTLYTPQRLVTVVEKATVLLTPVKPANGTSFTAGAAVSLEASSVGGNGRVQSVKFYANGALIASGANSNNRWTAQWTVASSGIYNITSAAFDAEGVRLAEAAGVTINVAPPVVGVPTLSSVSITPPHLSNPDAGTLPGDLTVTPSGAAAYSIPLAVPPGTAGLAPALSLEYAGDGPNGHYGLGWSLSGLSSVHRCGKTIAQDGVNDRIKFDLADRLCLDGQRLVLVNLPLSDENYWSADAEYRTEIDSFSRIRRLSVNGLLGFKVELKDGRVMTYGTTADSTVAAVVQPINSNDGEAKTPAPKSGPLSWALDRSEDRAHNYIRYAYTQNTTTGEHRLETIRYGGVNLPAHAAVTVTYDEGRHDVWKRYVDEARNDIRGRVSHIKTYVGTNLDGDISASGMAVRDYLLTYEQSPTSGRSLLNAVQVSARNPQTGAMDTLPATRFDWGKPDPSKTPGFESKGYWPGAPVLATHNDSLKLSVTHSDYFAFADFENHGYTDLLEKRIASPWQPYSLETEYYVNANPIQQGTEVAQYRYFHNNGAGFDVYPYHLSTGENFSVLDIGDFDGDGAPDLVASTSSGTKICLSPLGKGSLGAPGTLITFTCASAAERPAVGTNSADNLPYVVDLVGDGRSALYSRIDPVTQKAQLAIQNQLMSVSTSDLPYDVLAYTYEAGNSYMFNPRQSFVAFSQMVDLAGMGKSNDVRWTMPYLLEPPAPPNEQPARSWQNLAPIVVITNFHLPGVPVVAPIQSYWYKEYPSPSTTYLSDIYSFDAPLPGANIGGDFNGSGYGSVVFGFQEFQNTAGPSYASRAELTFCQSTGRSLDCGVRRKYSGRNYQAVRAVGDFVGDGQPKILVETTVNDGIHKPVPQGTAQMCRVTGDDTSGDETDSHMVCEPWPGIKIPSPSFASASDELFFMDLLGTGRTQLVVYRAGKHVGNSWQADERWEVFVPRDVAMEDQALDRIHRVTNGLGAISSVKYVDGLPSGVVTRSGNSQLAYPEHTIGSVGKVVGRLLTSLGGSAHTSVRYNYQDPAVNLTGREGPGFASVIATDEQTGVSVTTKYHQTWPLSGKVLAATRSVGSCTLSDLQNRWINKAIPQANGLTTSYPYVGGSVEQRRDLDCSDLGTITMAGDGVPDVEYDNWGNLRKSSSTVTGSLVNPGASVTTTIGNDYVPADIEHWQVGLLETARLTKRQSADNTSVPRTTAFTYETNFSGKVKTITAEPGDALLSSTITYEYNGFGLIKTKTLSWNDAALGAQRRLESKDYDANGRFATSSTNALSQTETRTYSAATGVVTSHTDVNLLPTTWKLDAFGNIVGEQRPDGNETRKYAKQCDSACPAGAVAVTVVEQFNGSSRIAVPQVSYSDSVGHVLMTRTWGFDGRAIESEQTYDERGRPSETSWPHFAGETAYLKEKRHYDVLDRVTMLESRDEHGGAVTQLTEYHGMETRQQNGRKKNRIQWRDASGRLERTVDEGNVTTRFTYEPFGNLATTVDPNGNWTWIAYDRLGRKKELNDPDLGKITYGVDAIGQVRTQTNASNQVTTITYDSLGRMTDRVEPSLSSHWVYDTGKAAVGKLVEAYTGSLATKDYQRLQTYDDYGRPFVTTQYIRSVPYVNSTSYDGWGRVSSQSFRRASNIAKDFGLRYNDYGYLSQLQRGSQVLWQATEQDASLRMKRELLGNGLVQTHDYNPNTGRLDSAILSAAGQQQRLQEGYEYDEIGNVRTRTQVWLGASFREVFTYDALNRVETSQVDGQVLQQYGYHDAGNLISKTGLGVYDYGPQGLVNGKNAPRPHAVKSIGGQPYFYDDRGNLLEGGGRKISWTSFDMPDLIEGMGTSSSFVYGDSHQRIVQTRKDNSVTIYAGQQEVEMSAGGAPTVKTYWPLGIGLEIDYPDLTSKQLWTHKDRLGSVVAMTSPAGGLLDPGGRMAYDTWGQRRAVAGGPEQVDLTGQPDNKGFTGHEMLDALGLVHMNGRVYDPLIGRFISGDPLIQDPENGQSFNRYSYVLNNPTNLTDPTGFSSVTITGDRINILMEDFKLQDVLRALNQVKQAGYNTAVVTLSWQAFGTRAAKRGGYTIKVKLPSDDPAPSGSPNQPETNYGDHWAEYKREVPSSGGDGPSTNATGYDDWALGKGYLTKEQWQERAIARGVGVGIGVGSVAAGGGAATALAALSSSAEIGGAAAVAAEQGVARVTANKVAGNAFRDEIAEGMRQMGFEVRTEVYKWTIFGKRFIDIEVSRAGVVLGGIEAKYGNAVYSAAQRAKDAWLNMQGYVVNVVRSK